jgi:LPS export ABC transporter permease LptG/LPS export ABC transporter permease LptF
VHASTSSQTPLTSPSRLCYRCCGRMLRILDRYTLREILPPFVLALTVFTFMLMMQTIDRDAEALLGKGVSIPVIGRMLLLLVPSALAITIPMAFLLGLLVAFGRLSGDSEWVALQACGVTLLRMLRPVMTLAVLCWAATLWVFVDALPRSNQAFREIEYGVVEAKVESEIKPGIFFEHFPNMVLLVRDTGPGGQGWRDVFVADTRKAGAPQITVARTGRMILDRAHQKVELALEDQVTYQMGADARGQAVFEANASQFHRLELHADSVFPKGGPIKGDAERTIAELRATMADLKKLNQPTTRQEYFIQIKYAVPVACFVFALMGLGLGVSSSRGGKLAAFALGSGVIFVYYIIMFQLRSLAMGHQVPAWPAAWLPNLVLGPAGAVILYRRARSSGRSFQLSIPAVGFLMRFLPARQNGTAAADAPARPALVIRFPHIDLPQLGVLDRYIARRFVRLQALTFFSLLGIFYISTFIDLSDKLFRGSATAGLMARLFLFRTPEYVHFILPLSVLIATLVTVGALTRSSELTVMRACGISLYRTAVPLLGLAAASGVLLFAIDEYALAPSNRQAKDLDHLIRHSTPRTVNVLIRRWTGGRNGDIYHYGAFDPTQRILHGFWKFEFDPQAWRLSRITYTASARFDEASARTADGLARWKGAEGWTRKLEADGASEYSTFSARDFTMEAADYFGTEQPDSASMTYGDLRDYIDSMRGSGLNVLQQLVDLHRKIAFPFVTIVMTMLAVPFAVTTGRRGTLYGIGVGIVLAIMYWTTNSVFGVVGSLGIVTPWLAAWAPNLLFGAGAAYLILTVRT